MQITADMPFWAGMLTESQHPYPGLAEAIRQASWDLYFRNSPVCQPPDFVRSPGLGLDSILNGRPVLVLDTESSSTRAASNGSAREVDANEDVLEAVKLIRGQTHQSWINIRKASKSLQGETNVENSVKSCVRRISRETGLSFGDIESLLDRHGLGK